MTLEEYIDSLLAQGLDQEEITRLAEEFVANGNKAVEEAKIQDGVMSASAPSIGPQPAQEITMESLLESGFADSLEIDEIERTFENRANGEVAPNSYLIETNQSESEFEKLQKEYFKDSTIDLSPDLTNVGFYNRAAVTKDFFEKNKNTYAEKFINDGSEARAKINDLDLNTSKDNKKNKSENKTRQRRTLQQKTGREECDHKKQEEKNVTTKTGREEHEK